MNKLAILGLVSVLFMAGCLGSLADVANDIVIEEVGNDIEPEDPLEPEPEVTLSDLDTVKNYVEANPIAVFGEQSSRIISVDSIAAKENLVFRTSTSNPGQESWYYAGVLFIIFPELDDVDVVGLNHEDKEITDAHKFPTRHSYDFLPAWFPDYEAVAECSMHSDCDDGDSCTKDGCFSGKCSNPQIVDCV